MKTQTLTSEYKSVSEGRILHHFLRHIIDENGSEWIAENFYQALEPQRGKGKTKKNFSLSKFISELAKNESIYSQHFAPGVPITGSLREYLTINDPEDMPTDIDQPDLKVTYEISSPSYEGISVLARKTLIRTPDEMIIWDIDAIEAAMKTQITKEHFEFKH